MGRTVAPPPTRHDWTYLATLHDLPETLDKVEGLIDGDTMDFTFDLGLTVRSDLRVRLYGLNTPEIRGSKAKTEREAGMEALEFVKEWFTNYGNVVLIRSWDGKKLKAGKYGAGYRGGRWIAEIFPINDELEVVGMSLNEDLIASGHAERKNY